MKKKWFIFIFCVFLIVFSLLCQKIGFHDTYEYITVAKSLSGINNLNFYVTHSIFFPFIVSIFLKIVPSLITIKLVNLFGIIFLGIIFLYRLKNKKAFLLFAFSPLVWFISVQITPIIFSSVFLFLAYLSINEKSVYQKYLAGFYLGLAIAFYTPCIILAVFFILVFFWDKKFKKLFLFCICLFLGIIPRFILDFYYFGNPLYTFIRYAGARFIISMGLHLGASDLNLIKTLLAIFYLFVISPFAYKIYFVYKDSAFRKKFLFVSLSFIFLLLFSPSIKYFFLISPIIILLISQKITYRQIKINNFLSIILVFFLCFSFFGVSEEVLIKRDLEKIMQDFDVDQIISSPYYADRLSTFLWKDKPQIIWFMNYNSWKNQNPILKEYSFILNKQEKIHTREGVSISSSFIQIHSENYSNYIFVGKEGDFQQNFTLEKCYEILCVYNESI